MDRLEAKKVNGKVYYYYSKWGWKDGKCRRLWQKYLGKPEKILKLFEGDESSDDYAEVFEWGLSAALWKECSANKIIEIIDELCPKRNQNLSIGEYIALAAINRGIQSVSKASIWDWLSGTVLVRHIKDASKATLSSQRFWDHMDRISSTHIQEIWERIFKETLSREKIDLSSISYDGTNFYTFIDTFNVRCGIAKRGKNKQGRNNLRQVSYALFCSEDSHIPLYFDVYDGNRNDARQFPEMLESFHHFWSKLSTDSTHLPDTTIVFDKGNNSLNNFALIDSYDLKFVGSVKLGEHKELAVISNSDERFKASVSPELEGVKSIRVEKEVYGKTRTLIITYNSNLFHSQYMTLQNDINKALTKLSEIQKKLKDRENGIITKGKKPTRTSILSQSKCAISRPYLDVIIQISVTDGEKGVPVLKYNTCIKEMEKICDTYLGKTLLLTNRSEWNSERIISAYRSQYIVEDVFKEMKDRKDGSWWPMYHWTDSKIKVHALYCTIALLLRALLKRKVNKGGIKISMRRLLGSLKEIREVMTVNRKKKKRKTTLTKLDELQVKVLNILELKHDPMVLG